MTVFTYLSVIVLTALCFGVWFAFYKVLGLALPGILAVILSAFLFHRILMYFCTKLTFPGSTWLWKRNIENYYQKIYVIKTKRRVALLRSLIQYISEENNVWRDFITAEERKEIMRIFVSTIQFFSKKAGRRANTNWKEIRAQFVDMAEMMKDARVCFKDSQETMSFWDFLGDEKDYSKRSSQEILTLKFEDEKGLELIQKCKALEAYLYDLVCSKPFFKSAKRWLFSDHFGTLTHLREELSNIYQCQFISLNVPKNETLDCVLIRGSRVNRRFTENALLPPLLQDEETQSRPVIILCCPNAGYYEYMCYEGQWIDIYLKHGFQVFLWNYRGYGRSTGKPSPENLRRDGEEVVNYLREKLGVKTIGCHGESMGGLVAAHLARWKNIDFLCADRTFESLFKVGSHVAGRFLAVLYRFITLWSDQVSTDYLEASCYKILTFDPRDEVIPFLCSLKHGVTMKVILNDLEENSEPARPVEGGFFNVYRWLKKIVYAFRIERYYNKSLKKLHNYHAGLSKDQVIALFRCFERIFELWDSYAAAQRKINMSNKKGQTSLSLPILPTMRPAVQLKPSAGDILDNESNPPVSPKRSSKNSLANEGSAQKIELMQPSLVDQIDETPLLKKKSTLDLDLKKSFARKSYMELYNEEAQLDNQFTKFLGQVFSTLKSLEFAGVRISTILSVQEEHKLEAFEYFIKCLEVWGSRSPVYTPQHDILQNPNFYRTKGLNKLKNVTTRIDQTIKMENLTRPNVSKLETLIIRDLELICEILNILEKCIQDSSGYYHKSQAYRRSMDKNSDIELAPINLENSKQPLLASTRTQFKSNADNYHYSTGHLIPLSCGHNGILEVFEVEIYEQFLKNSYLT